MDRNKLAKLVLLLLAVPFAAYILIDCIAGYIPPTESYKKTPYQFEAAFNEQMAKYGMSIDIDSVNFTYSDRPYKTVPVVCEDGSKITCTYYPTSEREKSLLMYITFEQELTGKGSDKVYIEKLLAFMMDEFVTEMTVNKDESFEPSTSVTYNEAIQICEDFVENSEAKRTFLIADKPLVEKTIILKKETDGMTRISVSMHLWNN